MRARGSRLITLLLASAAISGAFAFTVTSNRWLDPQTTFHTGMSGTAPSGLTWSSALKAAMTQWNDNTVFTFIADDTYVDPCAGFNSSSGSGFPNGGGDDINSADFRPTLCGNSFGGTTLAITLSQSQIGTLGFPETTQSDIVFNSNFQWDIYDGPRQDKVDFRRVALHELGHALGLDHESTQPAIMASRIGDLHTLQADDIAGANSIYGGTGTCVVRDLASSSITNDGLEGGDCRVRDLFGGSDTSYVDVYRLQLSKATELDITMHSSELDAVLILADANLAGLEIFDDFEGGCDAHIHKLLPAGEYRLLANTYEEPEKCAGNTGDYRLTVSDSGMPLLGTIRNASGGAVIANTVITGGAMANGGTSFATAFTANQPIDVLANIVPDPLHVGSKGRIYVLAVLGDGRQFMKDANGQFVRFSGSLGAVVPLRTGTLAVSEPITVVSGLVGSAAGLTGQTITVFVGYALDTAPQQIWYGDTPIQFTISL